MPRPKAQTPSTGVIVRDAHLQIDLRAQGFGRERLDLPPTPGNIKYAERLRAEILGKIERGTFALADYFADSPRVKADAPSLTFKQLAAEWLSIKGPELQHSTLDHYTQTIESYHFNGWRGKHLVDLDYRQTMALLAALPENPKTFNNVASVFRQILEYGYKARLLREALHKHVVMRKHQKPGPDPLDLAEVDLLLARMRDTQARNYYEFAFFSGLRPSELIAMQWAKVDLHKGTVMVDVALTRWQEKGTKTGTTRTVELTSRARAALDRQRAVTQLAGGHVFVDSEGKSFTTTDDPLRTWWKPAMKLSGLRHRDARQTRHTFATICLMAGITPGWVAQQQGNSPEMFFRVYSRWIEGADKGAERRKLDAFLAPKKSPETGT